MAAMLALNKSALDRRRRQLAVYRRVLPSLDLKRRQLAAELRGARARFAELEAELQRALDAAAQRLPMAANEDIALDRLVAVDAVHLEEEQLLGTRLPRVREVVFAVQPYSRLAMPHWIDALVDALQALARLRIQSAVLTARSERLQRALTRTIQRVNLFEKLLIPRAEHDIHRIGIFLDDAARAGVVRAKIAKARHARTPAS